MPKEKITIQEYNPKWAQQFETLKNLLAHHLTNKIITIEHVGSTSVPGMKAKPIIDLDIVIEENATILKNVISILKNLGYTHLGDMGISGREAFKRTNANTPYTNSKREWLAHNLYVCKKESIGLKNHLALREYLRKKPLKVIEYSNLKQKLAAQFPYDIDAYVDGKTDFILNILKEMGIKNSDTQLIETQNKLKN